MAVVNGVVLAQRACNVLSPFHALTCQTEQSFQFHITAGLETVATRLE
jgi:hypothetical protein